MTSNSHSRNGGETSGPVPVANQKAEVPAANLAVYVAIRRDLKMRRGKEIAQGIHAVAKLGYVEGAPLVVVQVPDDDALYGLSVEASAYRVRWAVTVDAGRTEVPTGTITAIAIGPVEKGRLPRLTAAELY